MGLVMTETEHDKFWNKIAELGGIFLPQVQQLVTNEEETQEQEELPPAQTELLLEPPKAPQGQ